MVATSLFASADSSGGMTLSEALRLAEGSRPLGIARTRTFELQAQLRAAEGARWPALRLRQQVTRIDDNTVDRGNAAAQGLSQLVGIEIPPFLYRDSYRTELEAQIPIWAGGQLRSAVSANSDRLAAAFADEESVRRTVRAAVATAFFAQAAAEAMVEARNVALDRAERRRLESQRRLEVGLTTRQEVLRWKVEVERARADLAGSEADVLLARVELADLLDLRLSEVGTATLPSATLVDTLLSWALDQDIGELLETASTQLAELPEVRSAMAQSTAAEAERRRAAAALRPQINGAVSYGWLENDTLELDEFDNWSAVLLLEVPLDLNGVLRAQVAAARARQQTADLGITDARAAIFKEIATAAANLLRSRTGFLSARRAVTEAFARRELVNRQYSVGMGALLDVLDADVVLVSTEVEVVSAQAAFLGAVARLELAYPSLELPNGGLIP